MSLCHVKLVEIPSIYQYSVDICYILVLGNIGLDRKPIASSINVMMFIYIKLNKLKETESVFLSIFVVSLF